MTPAPARTDRDFLTTAAQVALVALPVIYGLGILVINLHLGQYGISFFGILRPRLVAVGLLLAFLIAVPLALGWEEGRTVMREAADRSTRRSQERRRLAEAEPTASSSAEILERRRLAAIPTPWASRRAFVADSVWMARRLLDVWVATGFGGAIVAALVFAGVFVLDGTLQALRADAEVVVRGIVTTVVFGGFGTLAACIRVIGEIRRQVSASDEHVTIGTFALITGLLSFGIALVFYARFLFPLIPQEVGGGRPLRVSFDFSATAPTPVSAGIPKGATVELLDDSELGYLIRVEGSEGVRVVFLDRTAVAAIIVAPRR